MDYDPIKRIERTEPAHLIHEYRNKYLTVVRIVEIDREIFQEFEQAGRRYVCYSVRFNPHDGLGPFYRMTPEHVTEMGPEFGNFAIWPGKIPGVNLPSELFYHDIEQNFNRDAAEKLSDFYKQELKSADASALAIVKVLKSFKAAA